MFVCIALAGLAANCHVAIETYVLYGPHLNYSPSFVGGLAVVWWWIVAHPARHDPCAYACVRTANHAWKYL